MCQGKPNSSRGLDAWVLLIHDSTFSEKVLFFPSYGAWRVGPQEELCVQNGTKIYVNIIVAFTLPIHKIMELSVVNIFKGDKAKYLVHTHIKAVGAEWVFEFCMLVAQSCLTLCDLTDPTEEPLQARLSVEFPRQKYWNGFPFPPPGDLPDPGIEHSLLHCRLILYLLSKDFISDYFPSFCYFL